MESFVLQLLIIGLIMLSIGIVMAVLAMRFIKREEHSILAILFAILSCPCIYIPINFTIGFIFARLVLIISMTYSMIMVILSVRNITKKKQ